MIRVAVVRVKDVEINPEDLLIRMINNREERERCFGLGTTA